MDEPYVGVYVNVHPLRRHSWEDVLGDLTDSRLNFAIGWALHSHWAAFTLQLEITEIKHKPSEGVRRARIHGPMGRDYLIARAGEGARRDHRLGRTPIEPGAKGPTSARWMSGCE